MSHWDAVILLQDEKQSKNNETICYFNNKMAVISGGIDKTRKTKQPTDVTATDWFADNIENKVYDVNHEGITSWRDSLLTCRENNKRKIPKQILQIKTNKTSVLFVLHYHNLLVSQFHVIGRFWLIFRSVTSNVTRVNVKQ